MRLRREKITRAKVQSEINLALAVKENRNFFYEYIINKMRTKESLHPVLSPRVEYSGQG